MLVLLAGEPEQQEGGGTHPRAHKEDRPAAQAGGQRPVAQVADGRSNTVRVRIEVGRCAGLVWYVTLEECDGDAGQYGDHCGAKDLDGIDLPWRPRLGQERVIGDGNDHSKADQRLRSSALGGGQPKEQEERKLKEWSNAVGYAHLLLGPSERLKDHEGKVHHPQGHAGEYQHDSAEVAKELGAPAKAKAR